MSEAVTALTGRLSEALWPGGAEGADISVFMLLDAAQDRAIYPRLRSAGTDAAIVPLYEGAAAAEMAEVAPYLVRLSPDSALLDWICREGWGANWGVLMASAAPMDRVRAHLRKLTRVRTEDGRVLLFRFYDPRTLTVFVPTCDSAQLDEFFGPVVWFAAENEDGAVLSRFTVGDGTLSKDRIVLR